MSRIMLKSVISKYLYRPLSLNGCPMAMQSPNCLPVADTH